MPKRSKAFPLALPALFAVVLATSLFGVPAAGAAGAPSAPLNLAVSAGPGAGAVALAWAAPLNAGSSPITNFGFAKSTDAGVSWSAITYFGSTALSAKSSSYPALACSSATPGGKGCRYRVYARNSAGTSVNSTSVISWVNPAAPGNRKGVATDATHVRLSWTVPSSTGGFALAYSVRSGTTLLTTTSSTSAIVACAKAGATTCNYGIDAHDSGGLGYKSAQGAVAFATAPGAPSPFTVAHTANDYVSGTAAFHLSWQPSAAGLPANHYQYQRCEVAVGAPITCATTAFVPKTALPSTTATSLDMICSGGFATCGYRVRGVNALGVAGAWATRIYGPSAPFYTSAEPGTSSGELSLSFSAPTATGAAGSGSYVVRECASTADCGQQANWPAVLTVAAPASSPLTVPCPTNATCRVRLEYVDGAGAASLASPQATTVPVNRPCTTRISAPASISNAQSVMSPGGVLCLNAGVYTEAVNLTRSGTATASITVESTPGQHAVLDGTGLSLTSTTSLVTVKGNYVEVLGVELRNSSGRGLTVQGSNDTVAYSTFHDLKFNAIVASGSTNLIQGNEAYNTVMSNANGAFGSHGWAEAMNTWQATNVTFRDNYIHDNWGEGINFISSTGSVADGNTVMNNFSVQIYNGNSKNSTITDNQIAMTNSTHSRASSQSGVLLSEEGCVQADSNIMISNNSVSGGTVGVGYWWTGCGGANNSYDHVTLSDNTISAPTAIRFDKVGTTSPPPVANTMQGNSTSGTISIGQPSGWTMS